MKKIEFTPEQKAEIIRLYEIERKSSKYIAKKLKCSANTIIRLLKSNNIKIRNASESQQKYLINQNKFKTIIDAETTYWLGIIAGDGHLSKDGKINLSFKVEDIKLIEKFRIFLESTHPIKITETGTPYIKKDGTVSKQATISICNSTLHNNLSKYFTNNKTQICNFPILPQNLEKYFILGLFDSDGCFGINNCCKTPMLTMSFVGTKNMVEKFQKILIENCDLNETKIQKTKSEYVVYCQYGGNKQLLRIAKYLYEDSNIFLERKKARCIKILLNAFPDDEWLISQSKTIDLNIKY